MHAHGRRYAVAAVQRGEPAERVRYPLQRQGERDDAAAVGGGRQVARVGLGRLGVRGA